jgi:SAM-dependent methyltransferase
VFFGYTQRFYRAYHAEVEASARAVAPLILRLARARAVVDAGCGEGVWLAALREAGAERVLGLDGPYVRRDRLRIPPDCFRAVNLSRPDSVTGLPAFDLAMSLEVAEHLPAAAAPAFVALLTSLAPVVLFSAAVPFQGGTGHVNEQWPGYWAALFAARAYRAADALRPRLWNDARVAAWYRQNLLVFVREDRLAAYPELAAAAADTDVATLARVHPELYARANERPLGSFWKVAAWLPRLAALRALEARRPARGPAPAEEATPDARR